MTDRYQVHSREEGWAGCLTITDENGDEQPAFYPTIQAARAAINYANAEAAAHNIEETEYEIYDTLKRRLKHYH